MKVTYKKWRHTWMLLLAWIFFLPTVSHARIYILIDQPANQRFPIAISDLDEGLGAKRKDIATVPSVIRNDLSISGYFTVVPPEAYLEGPAGVTADTIDFKKWTMVGAGIVVKGTVLREKSQLTFQLKMFDANTHEMLLGKQYVATDDKTREIAHRFSDDIMQVLTGTRGVFNTKIAYAAQTKKKGGKDVYVMDMDGENAFAVTKNKSINISPAWAPDGSRLAFTSYMNGGPDIYVYNMATRAVVPITSNGNTNITPSWSPDGSQIVFSSSSSDDSELYLVNPASRRPRLLNKAYGIDIAPRFSPDGGSIVYASERGGKLHVHKMSADGSNVQRLTFVGDLNDSPDVSPDGTKILFCGRSAGAYDVFTMDIDGSNIQRLTIGAGNNEHPRWSPDGRFITFSSTRDGGSAIYMMRYDGANPVRISKGNGYLPDWGPRIN